jgi:protein TonB
LDTLRKEVAEYEDLFTYISVPMELNNLKQYNTLDENKPKTSKGKKTSQKFKITDSLTTDSVAMKKKIDLKDEKKLNLDSLKQDSVEKAENEKKKNSSPDSVFAVKDLPKFPGGQSAFNTYITNSLTLSKDIQTNTIHGVVEISFCIDKFGNPVNIVIKKSLNEQVDKALFEIFSKMPQWIPSQNYNERLKLTYTIPIFL